MVFIDLGFVLLVGFLLLTETNPRNNVALPGEPEEQETLPEDPPMVLNLHFDGLGQFLIEDGENTVCEVSGANGLLQCMQGLTQSLPKVVFVLVPEGERASVQHLVSILDLCRSRDWTCTVRN